MKRFRGGLVFKAHRLLYHSTLGLREIKGEEEKECSVGVSKTVNRFRMGEGVTVLASETRHQWAWYESGYGYGLSPYDTAYRRARRTTRTRIRTRIVREGCTVRASNAFDQRGHQVQERLVDLTWGKLGSLRSRYERGVLRCYRDSTVNGAEA